MTREKSSGAKVIQKVLILGGQGRIGSSVAADIAQHTEAIITVTGRQQQQASLPPRGNFLALNLFDRPAVVAAIASHDLVVHCAGPFSYRDHHVLETCLDQRVNYLDVADNPRYVAAALELQPRAQERGVTAVVSTGVFPGISNSMVRQGIEQLDAAETAKLSYVVAGSGGAGVTVMRTTFLELQQPIKAWIDGRWQMVNPYRDREVIPFPPPYGRCGVYWFNTIEAMTLPASFPLKTVVTKFGSVPDVYNYLTWATARFAPKQWLLKPESIELLAQASYRMTEVSDRFTGIGIAMRVDLTGRRQARSVHYTATFVHADTATAAGMGTGSIAQALLAGSLSVPGVWPVEQALPTSLFQQTCQQRNLRINEAWQ